MSEISQVQDADLDDDPWGTAGSAANDTATVTEAHPHEEEPFHEDVVDAAATELPPRKKSIVPKLVIGGVFIAVLAVAGSGMYNLYRKIRPAPQEVATVDAPVDTPDPAPAVAALPGGAAGSGAATTIGAAPPPAAVDPAAIAAPAQPVSTVPVTSASPGATAVAAVTPAPAEPGSVAPAAAPAASASVAAASPAAPQPKGASTAAADVARAPEQKAAAHHVAGAAAPRHSAHTAKPHRRAVAASMSTAAHVASKRRHSPEHVASSADSQPAKPAEKAETLESSVLTGFRIESIEPHFGEHQNAWIRGRGGRLQVVRTGDMFEGGKVLRVDGAAYEVVTTQGVIR